MESTNASSIIDPRTNKPFEKRSAPSPSPSDDFWYTDVAVSVNGSYISPESALSTSVVYACTKILAESIAVLPLNLYKRLPDGGREKEKDHPIVPLLHLRPNKWMTHFDFMEMLQGHMVLRGNAYAQIVRNNQG